MKFLSAETISDSNALLDVVKMIKSIGEYEQLALEFVEQESEPAQDAETESIEGDVLIVEKGKIMNPTVAVYAFNIHIFAVIYEVFDDLFPIQKSVDAIIADEDNTLILDPEVNLQVIAFCHSMSELFKQYIKTSLVLPQPILFSELPAYELFSLKETAVLFQDTARSVGNTEDEENAKKFCDLVDTMDKILDFYRTGNSSVIHLN